ncbi:PfkB family carbohydrate kinase [Taklimakanibacter lacteus]|uniref:PfkB family carbohydrate kinase n=1 Tax=Taklimakanibacter lacteus TaxID=2268456 RepID=UPI0034D6D78D
MPRQRRMIARIATVGDNCIDRYLPPIDRALVGGNAVNVAVNLARAGHETAYFGAVGDDPEGRRTREVLASQSVDVTSLRTIAGGRTSHTVIATGADGDRHFVSEDFGVCRGYRPDERDMIRLMKMRHVHIGWLDDAGITKRALVQAGVSVSQDLSVNAEPRNITPDALTIAFISSDGSEAEARAFAERTLAGGAKLAVIMRGPLGSLATSGGEFFRGAALPVAVTDTTGAGDSFIAGFLSAHLAGRPVAECLVEGHAAAAETCRIFGGFAQD